MIQGKGDTSRGRRSGQAVGPELQLKRRVLDEIATRQRVADEKRKSDAELAEPFAGDSESAVL